MTLLLFVADVLIAFFVLGWTHFVVRKLFRGSRTFDIFMQLLASMFGCLYIIFVLVRTYLQHPILSLLRLTDSEVFLDTNFLCLWDEVITGAAGVTIFFTMLSCLHLFSHFPVTKQFHKAFHKAKFDLALTLVIFGVLILLFAHFAVSLFGPYSSYTSQPSQIIIGILSLFSRAPVYSNEETLTSEDYWGWCFLVFVGVAFSCGLLKAYILAVLCFHLRSVIRAKPSLRVTTTRLLPPASFIKAAAQSISRLVERQHRLAVEEGNQSQLPAEFILAEVEYQVDEMLFKMHALAAVDEASPRQRRDKMTWIARLNQEAKEPSEDDELGLILPAIDLRFLPAEDDEKQFRSQLEMEIFRQLQIVRDQMSSNSSGSETSKLLLLQRDSPKQSAPRILRSRSFGAQPGFEIEQHNLIPVTQLDGEEDGEWVEMEDLTEQRQLNPPCVSPPRQPLW